MRPLLQAISEPRIQPEGHIEELSTSVDGDEYSPIPPAPDSGYFSGEDTIIPVRYEDTN
jgi:hypothetical protein